MSDSKLTVLTDAGLVANSALFLGPDIKLGKGCVIADYAVIYGNVTLGNDVYIGQFCVIGSPHWGHVPAPGPTVIGNNCVIESHNIVYQGEALEPYTHVKAGETLCPEPSIPPAPIKHPWWQFWKKE